MDGVRGTGDVITAAAVASVGVVDGEPPHSGAAGGAPLTEVVVHEPTPRAGRPPMASPSLAAIAAPATAEAPEEAVSYWLCSSRCIQHTATTWGVVLVIVGVAAIVFGAISSVANPFMPIIVTAGALVLAAGLVTIFLAYRYRGLDDVARDLRAQTRTLTAQVGELRGEVDELEGQVDRLGIENDEYRAANAAHAATIERQAGVVAADAALLEEERRQAATNAAAQAAVIGRLNDTLAAARAAADTFARASVEEIANLKEQHAAVVAGLREAVTDLAGSLAAATEASARRVDGSATAVEAATRGLTASAEHIESSTSALSGTVTRVTDVATRLIAAADQLSQNSEAFVALTTENTRLRARVAELERQLPTGARA